MNEDIIKQIALELNIRVEQVKSTLKMLEDGNTIPFIARYRKEVTGNLDEEQIRSISEVYEYQVNLLKRKEDVIRLIDEKGLLTDKIKTEVMNASKLVEVEDLYRPYKEKKKTKATEAIKNGLEGLAKIILSFPKELYAVDKFLNDNVKTKEDALEGAKYIIAEYISDNAYYRKWIRNDIYNNSKIVTKKKKNAVDEKKVYEMYYDYSEDVKYIKPHRVLAINRGEKEGVLSVSLEYNKEYIYNYLEKKLIKDENSECAVYVKDAIVDSYKRLIGPSVEREIRSELTEKSEEGAIEVFAKNLENYLLTPPMKDKMILGLDPAYRTGCKLAVIDYTGQMLDIKVIYPHEPKNDFEGSKKIVLDLIDKYNIDIIAIGNGTASRESETFIANVIKDAKRGVSYIIVNEAGASVYSASKLAIEEFPNLHVEERSAISIARRLQDPLSELVKIDSKSIGVGQYQHDVKEKNLNEALDFVVSKSVNNVGVNINTASASILKYISGLTKKSIEKIIDFRNKHGRFNSRNELIDNKILSAKAYEQSIGFMRVLDGSNPLDKTSIHPESYSKTTKLLESIGMNYDSLGTEELISKLDNINIDDYSKKLDIDIYTLEDIINSLKKPNRDPRDDFDKPILKSDVLHIEDLKKGMELEGTVRNVVDFGAFIDIGIKNDGLVHISKITDRYIKHPSEVLSVGDIVTCYVDEVFLDKGKVALSLIKNDEK
ncbi:MAG TPA: RNA-binding transcriptional accessory protein [Firmicutes bacterium]|nr:RNA-binding transcriptional accessory protein [Bacillota bacterium]